MEIISKKTVGSDGYFYALLTLEKDNERLKMSNRQLKVKCERLRTFLGNFEEDCISCNGRREKAEEQGLHQRIFELQGVVILSIKACLPHQGQGPSWGRMSEGKTILKEKEHRDDQN